MPIIDLTNQDFESFSENVPRVKLSNMYIVENPLSLSGKSYIPRPSLSEFISIDVGPIRGVWFQAQKGETILYVVSGTTLYKIDHTNVPVEVGAIPGTDFCTFASSVYHIAICSSGRLYLYDGSIFQEVEIPDGQLSTDVTSLNNYFIIGLKDSNKFYWISPGETVIEGLSFTSAERNPDDIISVMAISDELWVIGQNTTEVFVGSEDADSPFVRVSGRVYQTGCVSKTSVVSTLKNTIPCLVWVTPSKEVVLSQGVPSKISNESVEEVLKRASKFIGWSFRTNKHDFYVLSTDIATLVYDLTSETWQRWSTYLKNIWNAVSGVQVNDTVYAVTDFDNKIYQLSHNPKDTATDYLVCEVSGFVPNIDSKPLLCNDVTLFLNYGFSDSYLVSPVVELKWSDDGGHTWSTYVQGQTGSQGLYDTTVSFRSLGIMKRPGRFIELRFSEVQSFRLDGATYNG